MFRHSRSPPSRSLATAFPALAAAPLAPALASRGLACHAEAEATALRHGPGQRWRAVSAVLLGKTAAAMATTIARLAVLPAAHEFSQRADPLQLLSARFIATTTRPRALRTTFSRTLQEQV